jgi:hypothetical protein
MKLCSLKEPLTALAKALISKQTFDRPTPSHDPVNFRSKQGTINYFPHSLFLPLFYARNFSISLSSKRVQTIN